MSYQMIADSIRYLPSKIIKQEGGTCSAHGFFIVLMEYIQSKYGIDVEFDIYAEFDRMKAFKAKREAEKKPIRWYVQAFMELGKEGYKTLDGKTVYIKGWQKVIVHPRNIAIAMQKHGALIIGLRRYKGHSLTKCDKDRVINDIPKGASLKMIGHVVALIGNETPEERVEFQNSWSGGEERNWRKVRYSQLKKLARYTFCFTRIKII